MSTYQLIQPIVLPGLTSCSALRANPNVFMYPTTSDINVTVRGSDWYWAVTGVMAASSIVFVGLSFTVPRRNRIFHYITASITLVAAIAYFTMASNLGYAAIPVEFQRTNPKVAGVYRQILYVRYIDWVITTPVSILLSFVSNCKVLTFTASPYGSPPDLRSPMAYNLVHRSDG